MAIKWRANPLQSITNAPPANPCGGSRRRLRSCVEALVGSSAARCSFIPCRNAIARSNRLLLQAPRNLFAGFHPRGCYHTGRAVIGGATYPVWRCGLDSAEVRVCGKQKLEDLNQ